MRFCGNHPSSQPGFVLLATSVYASLKSEMTSAAFLVGVGAATVGGVGQVGTC